MTDPIPNPGHCPVPVDEEVWLWFRAEEGPRKSAKPRRAGSYDWTVTRGRPFVITHYLRTKDAQ